MGVVAVKATEREPFWRFALAILAGGGRVSAVAVLSLFAFLSFAQWCIDPQPPSDLDTLSIERVWRPIFTFSCGTDTPIVFTAGCLAGSLDPGICYPNDCANDQVRTTNQCCPLYHSTGAREAVVAITEDHSCRAGDPYNEGYADGTVRATGSSTLRLKWCGNGSPPSEVRVVTVFRVLASASLSATQRGCTTRQASATASASAQVSGGPGFLDGADGLGNSVSVQVSARGAEDSQGKLAISQVWILPVRHDGSDYYVDIPYQLMLMADTDQSSDIESYSCNGTLCGMSHPQYRDAKELHPRIEPSARASIQRLFDIFTSGQDIYLVSSTSLVDGADALGCAPEFCGMRPATGQISWGVPFPAVDTAYTGWVRTTSPAPGTFLMNSGRYGLENVQVVIANEGKLLSEFWRDGPVQWAWGNTLGDPYDEHLGEAGNFLARTREVLVYDVDGTALRFLGRRTADGNWVYRPAQGVFSQLSSTVDSNGERFTLRGGAPGNMRAKGGWVYTFGAVVEGDREESTTPYAPLVQVSDPLSNTITVTGHRREDRLVVDPISGSSLAIGSLGVTYGKGSHNVTIVDQYGVIRSNLQNQLDPRYYREPLKYEEDWRDGLQEVRIGGAYLQTEGSPEVVARYGWSSFSWREQNILNHASVGRFGGSEGRLSLRRVGNLTPTTYSYEWLDETRFKIETSRGNLQTELIYRIDRETGKFLEATYRRPGLRDASWETHEYRFNRHGQVDRWRLSLDGVLKQEATYQFGLDSDPLAITGITVQYPQDGVTRSWSYGYTERNGETLLQSVQDPTGVAATVEYEDPNYPVLPSALVDGAGHRWEMAYTGPGLLRSFKEPERPAWTLEYYPREHSFQNKLEKIVDPTQREVNVTAYDLFGRPTRVEVRPEAGRLLYQETDWTMLGVPRTVRWSDGTQVDFYWHGSGLRAVRDARRRWVVFDYNLQSELGKAGLLNQIRILGPQPSTVSDEVWYPNMVENLNAGYLFASLSYDLRGRLTRVAGGNGVGVNYTYGLRDQLLSVRYDGDSRAEQFTYSCCGELKSWTKPDGRTVYFDYKAGLLTHIQLGNPNTNPAYTFDYDLAGRLKLAQSNTSWHQWVYEYELPDERRRNTGRLGEERNLLYGAGISYTHTYTYYPSGEVETSTLNLSAPQGVYQRQLRYEYDDAGRLTHIYYNNQLLAYYEYDGAGRLKKQEVYPLGTSAELTTDFTFADEQSVNAVGSVDWRWNGSVLAYFDYGYYPDGTLARARDQLAGQPASEWEWDYDVLGQLAYEKRRGGTGEWQRTDFRYDAGGNLWGGNTPTDWRYLYNQLIYVPRTGQNNNWYYAYTPNGERWRWWTTDRGEYLHGDVNRDGQVDDADLLAVQFALGRTDCPCPEDLSGDGRVDDADMLIVLFNFGQSAGGSLSWEYTYDVWGNLVEAYSPAAGRYRALYDALGRRVGQEIIRETGTTRTYYVYEGDTIVAEVDGSGRIVAEYVWGLLGPIARIDLQNPANTRYYVIDGLGHVRALVSPSGAITDRYTYDSWGNLIEQAGNTPNLFTWNGAYGYEFIPFTGLYHVGAREYDPRTARWLQRDPIDVAGGHPNVYGYCFNSPLIWKDPNGLQIVIFVHGTNSNSRVFDKQFISSVKQTFSATGHVLFNWSGTANYNKMEDDAFKFCQFVKQVRDKHPFEPIIVVAHSNGGNVATYAANIGAPINAIIRLGSPTPNGFQDPNWTRIPPHTVVFNFYDPDDKIVNGSFVIGAGRAENAPFLNIPICGNPNNREMSALDLHSNLRSKEVWDSQVAPILSQFVWSNPIIAPFPKLPW